MYLQVLHYTFIFFLRYYFCRRFPWWGISRNFPRWLLCEESPRPIARVVSHRRGQGTRFYISRQKLDSGDPSRSRFAKSRKLWHGISNRNSTWLHIRPNGRTLVAKPTKTLFKQRFVVKHPQLRSNSYCIFYIWKTVVFSLKIHQNVCTGRRQLPTVIHLIQHTIEHLILHFRSGKYVLRRAKFVEHILRHGFAGDVMFGKHRHYLKVHSSIMATVLTATKLRITLGSLQKYSMRMLGTSAKSVLQRVPDTCWYRVLPSIECRAWPISWNKTSTELG